MDTQMIMRKYRRNAVYYDFVTQAFARIREKAIAQLELQPGERVLDLGSGTGLSFALLERSIGSEGTITGVELSPSMLAKAREKIDQNGWSNITLIESNAETVQLESESVDAVITFYTHDIMSSPAAVERAVTALRPGGRFVASGSKLSTKAGKWLINPITLAYVGTAITRPMTVDPWKQLEKVFGSLDVKEYLLGSSYIACGIKRK